MCAGGCVGVSVCVCVFLCESVSVCVCGCVCGGVCGCVCGRGYTHTHISDPVRGNVTLTARLIHLPKGMRRSSVVDSCTSTGRPMSSTSSSLPCNNKRNRKQKKKVEGGKTKEKQRKQTCRGFRVACGERLGLLVSVAITYRGRDLHIHVGSPREKPNGQRWRVWNHHLEQQQQQ